MKNILILLLIFFLPAVISADIKSVLKKVKRIRLLKRYRIHDFKKAEMGYRANLGKTRFETCIFNSGTDAQPSFQIGFFPKSLDLKKLFKNERFKVLHALSLKNIFLILSEQEKKLKISSLPKEFKTAFKGFDSKKKEIFLKSGINFYATLDLDASKILAPLRKYFGLKNTLAQIKGSVGKNFIRFLADGKYRRPARRELEKVSLVAQLSGWKLPGLEKSLYSDSITLTLSPHRNKFILKGSTEVILKIKGKKLSFDSALAFNSEPGPGEDIIALSGKSKDMLPALSDLSFFKVKDFQLSARLSKDGPGFKLFTALLGKARIKDEEVDYTLDLNARKAGIPFLKLNLDRDIASDALLKVPGLENLNLSNVSIHDNYIQSSILFRGQKTTAFLLITPADGINPILALCQDKFQLANLLKGIKNNPLGELSLRDSVFLFSSASKHLPISSISSVPGKTFNKLGSGRDTVLELKPGINFFASAQLENKGFFGILNKHLGVSGKSATLSGTLGKAFFATLFKKKAEAGPGDFAFNLALSGIKPPKTSKYFYSDELILSLSRMAGKFKIQGNAKVSLNVGKFKTQLPSHLEFNLNPAGNEKWLQFTGKIENPEKGLVSFPGFSFNSVQLDAGLSKEKVFDIGLAGNAFLHKKTVDFVTNLEFQKAAKPQFVTKLKGNYTLATLIGAGQVIPGLDTIGMNNIRLTNSWISATAKVFNQESTFFIYHTGPKKTDLFLGFSWNRFSIASLVPPAAGTIIDEFVLENTVFVIPLKQGLQGKFGFDDFPEAIAENLADIFEKRVNSPTQVPIKAGINFFSILNVAKSGQLQGLLAKAGLKENRLTLKGVLDRSAFITLKDKSGLKSYAQQALTNLNIEAELPALVIPGLSKFFKFKPGYLRIKAEGMDGQKYLKTAIKSDFALTIKKKKLEFIGVFGFEKEKQDNGFSLKLKATSESNWYKPLGINWLNLRELELGIDLSQGAAAQGRNFAFNINSRALLGKNDVGLVMAVSLVDGKFDDIKFKIPGKVDLSFFPGIKNIPGFNEFSFSDLEVSPRVIAGTLAWTRKKIASGFAIYFDPKMKTNITLLYRLKDFPLITLLPELKGTLFELLKLPELVLGLSIKGINGKLALMPESIRNFLKGVIDDPGYRFKFPSGVSLTAAIAPAILSGQIKEGMYKLGVSAPVVISGPITGIFKGSPTTIALYGKLPVGPYLKNLPEAFSFARNAQGNLFFHLNTSLDVSIGFHADLNVVPGPGKKPLIFATDFTLQLAPDGVSIAATGRKDGDWINPFGLFGLRLMNPLLNFTHKEDTTSGMTISGIAKIKDKKYKSLTRLAVNNSTRALKQGILNMEAEQIDLKSYFDICDLAFKSLTKKPPVKKVLLAAIKNTMDRKIAESTFIQLAKGKGLYKILQMDKVPAFSFKNARIYLASPGASAPELPEIEGMGVALKAQLLFMKKNFAEIDNYLNLKGLKVQGNCYLKQLGLIKLDAAKVDIAAKLNELPRFIIKAKSDFIGWMRTVDIEFSKDKVMLYFDDVLNNLWKYRFEAHSVGRDILNPTDFLFECKLSGDFYAWLEKYVRDYLNKLFTEINKNYHKAIADLKNAEDNLLGHRKKLFSAREIVRERIRQQKENGTTQLYLNRITNLVNSVKRILDDKKGRYNFAHRDAKPYWRIQIAFWDARYQEAKFNLNAARTALALGDRIIPLDLDPDVAPHLEARDKALADLLVARFAEKVATPMFNDTNNSNETDSEITEKQLLVFVKANFSGKVSDLIKKKPALLNIHLKVLDKHDLYLREELYLIDPKLVKHARIIAGEVEKIFTNKKSIYQDEAFKNTHALAGDSAGFVGKPASGKWEKLEGTGLDIGVGSKGAAWYMGLDHVPYHWSGGAWQKHSGNFDRIDVDPAGRPWAVNKQGQIFRLNKDGKWKKLLGSATDIGCGGPGNGVTCVIGKDAKAGGYGIWRWTGSRLLNIPGAAGIRIDVDQKGNPWVITNTNLIYAYDGKTWHLLPGKGKDISIGPGGNAWLLGINNIVYKWMGKDWEQSTGTGFSISVDNRGLPWIIGTDNHTYRRSVQP
ncbi:tectonin domain-containing protein [Candidatus Riflebacteria bacterium]